MHSRSLPLFHSLTHAQVVHEIDNGPVQAADDLSLSHSLSLSLSHTHTHTFTERERETQTHTHTHTHTHTLPLSLSNTKTHTVYQVVHEIDDGPVQAADDL